MPDLNTGCLWKKKHSFSREFDSTKSSYITFILSFGTIFSIAFRVVGTPCSAAVELRKKPHEKIVRPDIEISYVKFIFQAFEAVQGTANAPVIDLIN